MESVNVATLKARLSHYLRAVRRGAVVEVVDRQTPVARLVPCADGADPLTVRAPTKAMRDVGLPAPRGEDAGSVDVLLEDRARDR